MKLTSYKQIKPFVREGSYEVDISPDYVEDWIKRQNEYQTLELDPDFQRAHVWTRKQQIAWLEYYFRGGRSGRVIYFNNPSWMSVRTPKPGQYNDFVLVDGKQRLTALRAFLANEIPLFGSLRSEYEEKRLFACPSLRFNVNTLLTRREVLEWYLQMNMGGTPHTRKELDRVIELYKKEVGK